MIIKLFYQQAGDLIDGLFFGNDFGSQTDLLMAPEQFKEFFFPWIEKFASQAHQFNLQVVLHSCGSIYQIVDQLIDAGVDAIHPIQAKAANMDAVYLSAKFKGRITFIGGVDTQDILPNETPKQVYNEVIRIRKQLEDKIVIGPSHEVLMSNVPYENIKAMCDAAKVNLNM